MTRSYDAQKTPSAKAGAIRKSAESEPQPPSAGEVLRLFHNLILDALQQHPELYTAARVEFLKPMLTDTAHWKDRYIMESIPDVKLTLILREVFRLLPDWQAVQYTGALQQVAVRMAPYLKALPHTHEYLRQRQMIELLDRLNDLVTNVNRFGKPQEGKPPSPTKKQSNKRHKQEHR